MRSTYDLAIRCRGRQRAIVAIANLTLWAASEYGIDNVYGTP